MPLIEELPVVQSNRVSHGWAYVPDTGPGIAAVQPGTRKRGALREAAGVTSAKHQRAIEKRLADLEKENHKEVPIPIPARQRDRNKKMTTNVRRIVTYQRTFAHYLADEEAAIANAGGGSTVPPPPTLPQKIDSGKKRDSGVFAEPSDPSPSTSRRKPSQRQNQTQTPVKTEPIGTITSSTPPPPSASQTPTMPNSTDLPPALSHLSPLLDLKDIPLPPSQRVIDALLSEPPLTYAAARAKPLDHPPPPQHFCCICGYWGVVRCRACAERTCGSKECYGAHREGAHLGL